MVVISEELQYVAWNIQFTDIDLTQDYFRFNEWMLLEVMFVPTIMGVNMIFVFMQVN